MPFRRAQRLDQLPPYLFVEIDRKKRAAIAAGRRVLDFGIGDPDLPTPAFVVERMAAAIRDPANHRYPSGEGSPAFRESVAQWFAKRYGITLDPQREVIALIGSKEGLGHLPLAVVNPGDVVLVPSPAYPVYHSATIFAGGTPHVMPLSAAGGWLPTLEAIPADVLQRTALMFINYPNNPIGATADLEFFRRAVALARRHGFVIAHDAAYAEMYYDQPPPSILQVDGASDCCVELHSLSKTFNMTGWRLGFAVGHPEVLAALAKVKANVDSGPFTAIQEAGREALRCIDGPEVAALRANYRRRRDEFVAGLQAAGFRVTPPPATFYIWTPVPPGHDSMGCVSRMLEEQAVVAVPGSGFGAAGEGYVRFSITAPDAALREAVQRLGAIRW